MQSHVLCNGIKAMPSLLQYRRGPTCEGLKNASGIHFKLCAAEMEFVVCFVKLNCIVCTVKMNR